MPPSHASNTLSLQWTPTPALRAGQRAGRRALRRHIELGVHDRLSILLLSIGFSPWSCLETRAQREARDAFEERLADCLPKTRQARAFEEDSSGRADLQGVWAYSTDDRNGYYLIGRCGTSLFYYEDGATGRLFGILVEGSAPREAILSCMLSPTGEPTTTFIVVLGTGMLVLCPSSESMTSRFKPWTGTSWHDPVAASKVGASPPQGDVSLSGTSARPSSDGKSSGSGSTTVSALDFAISVQKLTLVDEHLAQQAARLAAVDKAASTFQLPDGSSKGETQPRAAPLGRPVDVSGTWNVMERTDGRFTLSLQQTADGSLEGQWRYVDSSASGWSTKVSGHLEGRRIRWTGFAWKGGALGAEKAESTITIISPCGRYLAGTGPADDEPARSRQHFSAVLQSRPSPAAARAASAVREAQARRAEQEQPPPIPQSRSWASSFTAVSFTSAQRPERTSASPHLAPVKRFSFSGRRERSAGRSNESEPLHTAPAASKVSLIAQPWTDESPRPKVSLIAQPTSHRPGSKRAELARRWRTTVNVFRGGRGGYRGAPSETAGGAASSLGPPRPSSSYGSAFFSRSQSASVTESSASLRADASPRPAAARSVAQKWF